MEWGEVGFFALKAISAETLLSLIDAVYQPVIKLKMQ